MQTTSSHPCGPPDFVKPVARDSMRTSGVQIKFATARRSRQYPHHTCKKTNSGRVKIPKRPRAGLLRHSELGLKKFVLCSVPKNIRSLTRVFLSEDPRTCALGQQRGVT